jgi:aminoglycoside phosphotransferase (APT) family kinase protein
MTTAANALPAEILDWVAGIGGGRIGRLERHVARREAWVVDVERGDGAPLEGFLRIERGRVESPNISLRREARICAALSRRGIPVPALLGWDEAHRAALFSRDAGRADIHNLDDRARQRAIMEDFIDIVARLHQLAPEALGLDDVLGPLPQTPAACALGDLDAQLNQYGAFLDHYTDPLITYAVQWLQRNVPERVARVSLVQGDTGPVNFMFQGDRVSAVVDWEWGHWGDPMEDLGNICVREFWNPSGGLQGLFKRYEARSGIPYDRFSAQYYRIQQNVRGMIPIHAACRHGVPGQSLAWYLCYRYVGDRSTCEALADAMAIDIGRPELPKEGESTLLSRSAATLLEQDVAPRLDDAFAASRAQDLGILVQCLDREHRHGEALRHIETEEIGELLGVAHQDHVRAIAALDNAVRERQVDEEALVRYLARRAYREEWLYQPVTTLYPDRQWSPLD